MCCTVEFASECAPEIVAAIEVTTAEAVIEIASFLCCIVAFEHWCCFADQKRRKAPKLSNLRA